MQHQHQAFEQIFVVKNLSLMREMYMRTNSTRMGIKALNNGVNPFTHFFISNPNACLQRDLHPNALRDGLHSSSPGQNDDRHFADDSCKRIFLNEKFRILIKIALKFVPNGPIENNPALV